MESCKKEQTPYIYCLRPLFEKQAAQYRACNEQARISWLHSVVDGLYAEADALIPTIEDSECRFKV